MFNAQKQVFQNYFGTSLLAAAGAAAGALAAEAAETDAATGAEATTGAGAVAPSKPAEGFE
ncbi:exported hypothetical protein [Paraburkholderia sacchari]